VSEEQVVEAPSFLRVYLRSGELIETELASGAEGLSELVELWAGTARTNPGGVIVLCPTVAVRAGSITALEVLTAEDLSEDPEEPPAEGLGKVAW